MAETRAGTTATQAEFASASLLLRRLWFVGEEHLDIDARSIDWLGIDERVSEIAPSDAEHILLELALELWGDGELKLGPAMQVLDDDNWRAVLLALQVRRPSFQPPLEGPS